MVALFGNLPIWVEVFSGSGSGSYGSGYGDGSGSGSYGSGSYGSGYGDGSGSGSYGSGYGDGSGSGSGSGSYGSGSGSGSGYWRMIFEKLQLNLATYADCFIAFWKSDKDGLPSNGGGGSVPAFAEMKQKIDGPLQLCTRNALHATLHPEKWKGERLWVVALKGELAIADDKIGALEREILAEVK